MSNNRFLSLPVVGFLVGALISGVAIGAIGHKFLVSWVSSEFSASSGTASVGSTPEVPSKTKSHTSGESNVFSQSWGNEKLDSELTIQEVGKISSNFTRTLATHRLLSAKHKSELIDLLKKSFEMEPKTIRAELQTAIIARLAMIDPKFALSQVEDTPVPVRETLIAAIFGEWSQTELDDAVRFGRGLEKESQYAALKGILESRVDLSDERIRRIAHDFGDEDIANWMLAQRILLNPSENPREAWKTVMHESGATIGNLESIIQIANAWIRHEGSSVLQEISQSVLNAGVDLRYAVLNSAVREAALRDPETTLLQTIAMGEGTRRSFSSVVVREWATTDPQAAIKAITQIDEVPLRVGLQEELISKWAQRDPTDLLETMSSLPDNVQEIAAPLAIMKVAQTNPEEAIRLLQTHDVSLDNTRIANTIIYAWSAREPKDAWQWVLTSPMLDTQRELLLPNAIHAIASDHPDLALELALEQPADLGLEAYVVQTISHSDPLRAMDLLSKIRSSQSDSAHTSVGYRLIEKGRSELVLDLALSVPENYRPAFYNNILSNWAHVDPEGLLAAIDELPSAELKSKAAFSLASQHYAKLALTNEQTEYAKTFLTDWDAQRLENPSSHFRFVGGATEIRISDDSPEAKALIQKIAEMANRVISDSDNQAGASLEGKAEVIVGAETAEE